MKKAKTDGRKNAEKMRGKAKAKAKKTADSEKQPTLLSIAGFSKVVENKKSGLRSEVTDATLGNSVLQQYKHACTLCSQRFASNAALASHIRNKHKNPLPEIRAGTVKIRESPVAHAEDPDAVGLGVESAAAGGADVDHDVAMLELSGDANEAKGSAQLKPKQPHETEKQIAPKPAPAKRKGKKRLSATPVGRSLPSKGQSQGKRKRRRFTFAVKLEWLKILDQRRLEQKETKETDALEAVADLAEIDTSTLYRWDTDQRAQIIQMCKHHSTRNLKAVPSRDPRYPEMEEELARRFDERRAKKRKVSARWIMSTARMVLLGLCVSFGVCLFDVCFLCSLSNDCTLT